MSTETMLLTDKAIARIPLTKKGQQKVRDTELSGFFLQIGKRSKTYMVQGEYWSDGFREFAVQKRVARFGEISTREARTKAMEILVKIAKGERPNDPANRQSGSITLRKAWERYRDSHMVKKGRADRTIENYRDYVERLLGDWMDWPLEKISRRPDFVIQRHEHVTNNNGPYIANSVMKVLRAIYNHALKSNRELSRFNPVLAVDWNVEKRRNSGMGESDLANWFSALHKIQNPIRREFHLLVLLTGSRPSALKSARVEHLDFKRRILHIPKPKGGVEKAFDIPLSKAIIRSLLRVIRFGRMMFPDQSQFWLFPAESVSGHLIDHKEDRDVLSKWGNDLRQSYRTIAQAAEVSELDVHLLMNHSLRGVNAGYITKDKLLIGHLRRQQERISSTMMEVLNRGELAPSVAQWLRVSLID